MSKFTNEELQNSMDKYSADYSESGFLDFVVKYGKKAGRTILEQAFTLYYVLKKSGVPMTAKGMIMGALAYLVMPVDLIPDMIPVIGLTDDAAAIALAISQLRSYIDPAVEQQAGEKVKEILG